MERQEKLFYEKSIEVSKFEAISCKQENEMKLVYDKLDDRYVGLNKKIEFLEGKLRGGEEDYRNLKAELDDVRGWTGDRDEPHVRELQGLREKHKELCEENLFLANENSKLDVLVSNDVSNNVYLKNQIVELELELRRVEESARRKGGQGNHEIES